uniref:SH3 and cysteine rich domain 2 n=1 Tax=Aquila chrysaetos chrysaetos TaxID=223781 RepID=A0A663E477_AQUCH
MTELPGENEPAGIPPGLLSPLGGGSMQRLKRSLSLRTLLRSKSVESLFPRPGGGVQGPGTPPSPPRTHGFQQYVFKKHCPSGGLRTPARRWTRCTRRCGSAPPWHTAPAPRSCPPLSRYPPELGRGGGQCGGVGHPPPSPSSGLG